MQSSNRDSNNKFDLRIDLKVLLLYSLRYWYLLVLGLSMSLIYAFYQMRYTPATYQTSSRMLVKDEYSSWGQEYFLPGMELVSSRNRLVNEIGLIKSFPLMLKVAQELNWDINYFKVGNIKTSDTYPRRPFSVVFKEEESPLGKIFIEFVDSVRFRLGKTEDDLSNSTLYTCEERISLGRGVFSIHRLGKADLSKEGKMAFQVVSEDHLARSLQNSININVESKESSILIMSTMSQTPLKSIDILNALMNVYIQWGLEKNNEIASNTIDFVDSQLSKIADSLVISEIKLEQFQQNNFADRIYPNAETSNINIVLDLEDQLAGRQIQREYYAALSRSIKQDSITSFPSTSLFGFSDPNLDQLITDFYAALDEKRKASFDLKQSSKIITNQDDQIKLKQQTVLEYAESSKERLEDVMRDLKARIDKEEIKVLRIPKEQREYLTLRRQNKLMNDLYTFLLNKRSEASIAKASNVSKAQILDYASKYRSSYVTPKPHSIYLISILLGIGIPMLVIVFLYVFNNKIVDPSDLDRFTSVPILGSIAHKPKLDNNILVYKNLKSVVAESFRSIRTNLNFMVGGKDKAKILVTSSISGEGKTFTSINLSIIYAASDRKTVLVGADLRKPKIFQDFNLKNEVGLSSYLIGKASKTDITQKTFVDNLDLISSGPIPPNPAELIEGDKMKHLMGELEKEYDIIIIDSPPIGLVTDALLLNQYVDASLYIVRHNYTKQSYLQNIEQLYRSKKIKQIGIVVNAIKERAGVGYSYGYGYGYSYGYGYGYYAEDKPKRKKGMFGFRK